MASHPVLLDDRNILVSGLSPHVTIEHLGEIFACFGTVIKVAPVRIPRLVAMVVTMASAAEAKEAAFSMDKGQVDGKVLWAASVFGSRDRCKRLLFNAEPPRDAPD
ncbi:hypothetical protein GNI_089510 [Gregarina niphandrodes]|uniref:RRM domain-containing protein n=1 Tax=Gregarina niphandrodes TaxID=110365 RepID=A0A023B5M6_GRENI|nr:hypothetical protein GNI_089510 [Gregarina niphandrodes]EZG61148.1 hypothetical protein GNI_089510 [Gregarina niphandrodes]|eukprot:XP_011130801.1 hypothetical protein GNI_089510 [Gregarina niphandrodes]